MLAVNTAIFVNVGRGDNVDESALITALSDGEIAACCLDVFAEEPLPPCSPIWKFGNDRILLSPVCPVFFILLAKQHYLLPFVRANALLPCCSTQRI